MYLSCQSSEIPSFRVTNHAVINHRGGGRGGDEDFGGNHIDFRGETTEYKKETIEDHENITEPYSSQLWYPSTIRFLRILQSSSTQIKFEGFTHPSPRDSPPVIKLLVCIILRLGLHSQTCAFLKYRELLEG